MVIIARVCGVEGGSEPRRVMTSVMIFSRAPASGARWGAGCGVCASVHGMDIRGFLARSSLMSNVDPALVQRLAGAATWHSYERGEHLWRAGDEPLALMVARSGLVKLVRAAPHGRTAICA